MTNKYIYIPSPYEFKLEITSEEIEQWKTESTLTNIGWPQYGPDNGMYGKTTSDKQKKAVSDKAREMFTGVPKWYKVNNPVMYGSDNPKSRKIYAEGKVFNSISECQKEYGFKNHNAIRYRLNHPKWTEWYYLN